MSFAFTFRCSERQVDICIKMTTPSQLETVRKKIDDLEAEILNTKEALAVAQRTTEIEFLRKRLEQLDRKEIVLREKENILLQGQASGEHCLSRYLLLSLSCVACTLILYVMFQRRKSSGVYCGWIHILVRTVASIKNTLIQL